MKQVSDIQKEITEVTMQIKDLADFPKDVKKLKKRLPVLLFLQQYLETAPTEEFLRKEVQRLSNRVKEVMKMYVPLDPQHNMNAQISKHKREFEKIWEIPKIKKQIEALKYLLK